MRSPPRVAWEVKTPCPSGFNIAAWNSIAASHVSTVPLEQWRGLLRGAEPRRVLDLGCGYGRAGHLFDAGGGAVVSVDAALRMIARGVAEDHIDRPCAAQGEAMPFRDRSFDIVLLIGVLSSVPSVGRRRAVLREVHRILTPGGYLLLSDFAWTFTPRYLARYLCGAFMLRRDTDATLGSFRTREGLIIHHFSRRELTRLVSTFTPLSIVTETFPTMHGNRARGFHVTAVRVGDHHASA